jgi:hypothetical protein
MELIKIESKVHELQGLKIILDFDLAELYEVETKNLNKAVSRNRARFPDDFMFQLTNEEWEILRFQIGTSSSHGGSRYLPYAFTEQGIAMLSSVLRSEKAISVNIGIMRAFVLMRQFALSHIDLTQKIKELEEKYDASFNSIYDAIDYLLTRDFQEIKQRNRKKIGYK